MNIQYAETEQSTGRTAAGHPRGRHSAGAYTLIETSMAIAIMTIVFAGIGSAIVLASRSLTPGPGDATTLTRTAAALQRAVEQLSSAMYITEHDANAITFVVADRNGDGLPEVIRYAWSGTAGDPLTRRVNTGEAVDVIKKIEQFTLDYETYEVTTTYPGPTEAESPEVLMLTPAYTSSGPTTEFPLREGFGLAQCFRPDMPSDALSWGITRIQYLGTAESPADGTIDIQVRFADENGTPTSVILDKVQTTEDRLDQHVWDETVFPSAHGLDPALGCCVVFEKLSGDDPAGLLTIGTNSVGSPDSRAFNGSGLTWAEVPNSDLWLKAWGTITLPSPPQTASRERVKLVRINLKRVESNPLQTTVRMLDRPEVLSAVWATDFSANPTALDFDGDAVADWSMAGPFDASTISNGVWLAYDTLETAPDNLFTTLTSLDVKFRDTTTTGLGAGLRLHVDHGGGFNARLIPRIKLQEDGTQRLTVNMSTGTGTETTLVDVPDMGRGFIHLRLLIDPNLDTVHVKVNGMEHGTYVYVRTGTSQSRRIQLQPESNDLGAEFDFVRIRVGVTP